MNRIAPRSPMGLKQARAKPNPGYLARVRELSCVICDAFGERQTTPTEAHHPIHGRYGTRKTPDEMCIPLCTGHHRGDYDTTKLAIHKGKEAWAEKYGFDFEWIAVTQDRLNVKGDWP